MCKLCDEVRFKLEALQVRGEVLKATEILEILEKLEMWFNVTQAKQDPIVKVIVDLITTIMEREPLVEEVAATSMGLLTSLAALKQENISKTIMLKQLKERIKDFYNCEHQRQGQWCTCGIERLEKIFEGEVGEAVKVKVH